MASLQNANTKIVCHLPGTKCTENWKRIELNFAQTVTMALFLDLIVYLMRTVRSQLINKIYSLNVSYSHIQTLIAASDSLCCYWLGNTEYHRYHVKNNNNNGNLFRIMFFSVAFVWSASSWMFFNIITFSIFHWIRPRSISNTRKCKS